MPREFIIGRWRSSKADAGNLVDAAEQLAEMLQLPIEIVGELNSASLRLSLRFGQLCVRPAA